MEDQKVEQRKIEFDPKIFRSMAEFRRIQMAVSEMDDTRFKRFKDKHKEIRFLIDDGPKKS